MTTPRSVLLIGASRGIGLGLARRLHSQGWQVTATVRDTSRAQNLDELGIPVEQLDIDQLASVEALKSRLGQARFDLIFVNAGISGPAHQSLDAATREELGQLFLTNAIAPVRTAEHLLDLLNPRGTVGFMSSIMGSIALNESSYHPLYKASKAALNSLAHGFYNDHQDIGLTVLSMHPGWVRTDMGGSKAPLDVETSCAGLVEEFERHAGTGKHLFLDYKGEALPW